MAGPAGDYHRGEMDVSEQVSTYKAFLTLAKWGSLILAVGILFFALLFAAAVGFLGSAASAVVLLVIGFLLLRSKPGASH
jgi:hypothetical protein